MKTVILILSLSSGSVLTQVPDTVSVYNVHCSGRRLDINDNIVIWGWGGTFTSFYPTEFCPEPKQKYIDNHEIYTKAMDDRKIFWIKVYNTGDTLLYEGLQYSDCHAGPFICYWPNGNVRVTGQYPPLTVKRKGKVILCDGGNKPSGIWKYYNEDGTFEKEEQY
jgi:hypothetical protein